MKRIFISSDIEGTCGIAHWDETELRKPDHARFARQMTREASAACEGAFAAGADDILIKDAHDSARNLLPEELPEGISIFRGWGSDIHSMMSGIDESFAGCFFTGYHSSSNTDQNPLSHTFNTRNTSIRVNGIQTSEMLMNAYSAALYDVPVLLVTGDLGVCEQAKALLPGVYTVPVSRGRGNGSISIHPAEAVRRIREATGKKVIKAIIMDEDAPDPDAYPSADYLLFDAGRGSGRTFRWDLLAGEKRPAKPFFLAGGLNPDNVGGAAAAVRPFGVDVSSGVEDSSGRKSSEAVKAFAAALRPGGLERRSELRRTER